MIRVSEGINYEDRQTIYVNGTDLENLKEFKYLGSLSKQIMENYDTKYIKFRNGMVKKDGKGQ